MRDLGGIVLKIRVQGDEPCASGLAKPRLQGGGLAKIAPEAKAANSGVLRREFFHHVPGAIVAAIIDEHDLDAQTSFLSHGRDLSMQLDKTIALVVERNDQREGGVVHAPSLIAAASRCRAALAAEGA